jgi:hypothetical protein
VLLCNGYDPNLEPGSPLDLALRARRWDLLDLLLEWGADPHDASLDDLFDTYNSALWERFRTLGVDLTAGHALADALAHHSSNKPLFGFAKRHREQDPKMQVELNMALSFHVETGSEKGVQLCLWAGADPHARAPSLRDPDHDENDDNESEGGRFAGFTAIWLACIRGDADILRRLGPDPSLDNFDELYRAARNGEVIELLARHAPPQDVGALLQSRLWALTMDTERWRSLHTLQRLFEVGGRWRDSSADTIATVRRLLLKTSDSTFVEVIKLFAQDDYCAAEVLTELARTPSMRARMQKVGFIPTAPNDPRRFELDRPTRSREVLKKCGVELPKHIPSLPRCVKIGAFRRDGRKLQMDRSGLFERVWTTPIVKLAQEWGISDVGLAKACRRLQVPLPPRGYWAKRDAGQQARRPKLPALRAGEAEEIVFWAPG